MGLGKHRGPAGRRKDAGVEFGPRTKVRRAVEVTREGQTVRFAVELEFDPAAAAGATKFTVKEIADRLPESAELWVERLAQVLLKDSTFRPVVKMQDLKFSQE